MSSAMKAQLERSMKAAKPWDRITLLVLQPQPRAVFWELTLPHREESHSGSRAVVDLSPQAGGHPALPLGTGQGVLWTWCGADFRWVLCACPSPCQLGQPASAC